VIFILGYGERLAKYTVIRKLRIEKGFDDILCCRRFDSPSRDEGFSGITVTTALGKAFGMPKDISNYLCEIGVSNSYQTIRRRGQKDFAKKLLGGQQLQGREA
jgi:hypothetical protein